MKTIKEQYPETVKEISIDIQEIIDVVQILIEEYDIQDLRYLRAVALSLKRNFKELTN